MRTNLSCAANAMQALLSLIRLSEVSTIGFQSVMKRLLITVGLAVVMVVGLIVAAGYLATMEAVGHFAPTLNAVPA